MMYQCGRCGLTRASGQEMGVIAQCKCPWEFVPPVAPQRTWVGLMRGVRVEGDIVVISVKGGNDAARELCGELINEMNK